MKSQANAYITIVVRGGEKLGAEHDRARGFRRLHTDDYACVREMESLVYEAGM